jgi:hypothetical protein
VHLDSSLVSMFSHMHETEAMPDEVHFLFTTKVKGYYNVSHVPALERLLNISNARQHQCNLYLFFSGYPSRTLMEGAEPKYRFEPRRMLTSDVLEAFRSPELNASTVCYVYHDPEMTDSLVDFIRVKIGLEANQILYEKLESEMSSPEASQYHRHPFF